MPYIENVADSKRHGTWINPWDRLVENIGIDAAHERMRQIANPSKAGAANKSKK